jgi:hypothetical protein
MILRNALASIVLLAFFYLGSLACIAQTDDLGTKNKKAIKAFQKAQKEETDRHWDSAILSYVDAVNADTNFAEHIID